MIRNKIFPVLIFLSVLFISGCVQTTQTFTSVSISMTTSPPFLVPGGDTIVSIDVENNDEKTYENINLEIFNTGDLISQGSCSRTIPELSPDGIVSMQCSLSAPEDTKKFEEVVNAKASFSSILPFTAKISVITQQEYDLLKKTGNLEKGGRVFSSKDKNLEVRVELSEEAPLIKSSEERFATIKITNIGSGFVGPISRDDIIIESSLLRCNVPGEIFVLNKEFPTISCKIDFPENINDLKEDLIIITINYDYEVRKNINIPIR